MRPIQALSIIGFILFAHAWQAGAEHHEKSEQAAAAVAVTPWNQQAVTDLSVSFSKAASEAYTSIYQQGTTSGRATGSRRSYARLKDKARVIRSEARHLRAELEAGKGQDETFPVVERLMVDVRDIRVIGRRVDIQAMTQEKIAAAGAALREVLAYYDPSMFDAGSAPPLVDPES